MGLTIIILRPRGYDPKYDSRVRLYITPRRRSLLDIHQGHFYLNPPTANGTGGNDRTQSHTVNGSDTTTPNNSYDFSASGSNGVFTVEIWVNCRSVRADRGYCGQITLASKGGWCLGSGGTGPNAVRMWVSNDATDTVNCSIITANSTLYPDTSLLDGNNQTAVAHIVLSYDGTNGTPANRPTLYVNGVSQTLTITGTPPATIQMPSGRPLLHIGQAFTGTWSSLDGICGLFRVWKGAALSSANVTTLWNGGKPLYYASLGGLNTSQLVLALEQGGTTCLKTGQTLAANNGPIGLGYCVPTIRNGKTGESFNNNFGACLWYLPTGWGGKPCFASYGGRAANGLEDFPGSYFQGAHFNYFTGSEGSYSSNSGLFCGANQFLLPNVFSEKWLLGIEDYVGALPDKYAHFGYQNQGSRFPSLRLRNVSSPNSNILGETVTPIDTTPTLHTWHSNGSTTGYRRNGVAKTVTMNAIPAGGWTSQASGTLDRVTIGGFGLGGDATPQLLGDLIYCNKTVASGHIPAIEKFINQRYGIY
jgi:hypothetical protein